MHATRRTHHRQIIHRRTILCRGFSIRGVRPGVVNLSGSARATNIGSTAKPAYCNPFPIDQNQSFLWQQTAQVRYDGAIAADGRVLVGGGAHLLDDRQPLERPVQRLRVRQLEHREHDALPRDLPEMGHGAGVHRRERRIGLPIPHLVELTIRPGRVLLNVEAEKKLLADA